MLELCSVKKEVAYAYPQSVSFSLAKKTIFASASLAPGLYSLNQGRVMGSKKKKKDARSTTLNWKE